MRTSQRAKEADDLRNNLERVAKNLFTGFEQNVLLKKIDDVFTPIRQRIDGEDR